MTLAATLAGAGHHQLGVHEADFLFARLEGRPHSGVPRTDLWGQHGAMAKAVLGRTPGSPVSRSERGQSRGDPCPAPLRIRRQREISLPQRGVSPSTVAFSGDPQSCSQGQSEPSTQSSGSTVYHLWLRRSRSRFSYLLRGVCAHVCLCMCVHAHVCACAHACACVCAHMRVCTCACASVHVCGSAHPCACVRARVSAHPCVMCARLRAHMCSAPAHTCVHVCACLCACAHTCVSVCACACTCMRVSMRARVGLHRCVHVSVHACLHTRVRACVHTCVRVCPCVCVCPHCVGPVDIGALQMRRAARERGSSYGRRAPGQCPPRRVGRSQQDRAPAAGTLRGVHGAALVGALEGRGRRTETRHAQRLWGAGRRRDASCSRPDPPQGPYCPRHL